MQNKYKIPPGRFITFEGIDGSGKSTNIQYISKILTQLQIPHIISREPGGTRLGEKVREILIDVKQDNMHPMSELLLMYSARQQHISEVILPHLNKGVWVLCDRFIDASHAYQGGGRDVDKSIIKMLDAWVLRSLKIDLTFYLDISTKASAERVGSKNIDRFEMEGSEFMQKVRQAYIETMAKNIERFVLIDAMQPLKTVQESLKVALLQRIKHFNK